MPPLRFQWVDRGLVGAIVVAALVVLPRSYDISLSHNENIDADYHLSRGALFLERRLAGISLNDPPTGEGIGAMPLAVTGTLEGRWDRSAIYGKALPPETIVTLVALWKAVLFLPMVGVVFAWCRRLYGAASGALAVGLLLSEPTFAAHIPSAALDVLGAEGIVLACFLIWRYLEAPTYAKLAFAAAATAFAMTLKHTAVILPGVSAILAISWRLGRPKTPRLRWALPLAAGVWFLALWAFTLFDLSKVDPGPSAARAAPGREEPSGRTWRSSAAKALMGYRWPAGVYARSFLTGLEHDREGHEAYLLGETRRTGWWFYFPVVATYKVPLGVALVVLLGMGSGLVRPPRFEEWSLAVPLLSWVALLGASRIDIGFRHFLPAHAFLLMLASRCAALKGRWWRLASWGGLLAAAVHASSFHPDYLSYVNFPRSSTYLDISDSNVDWGESLKQTRLWLEAHPTGDRPVYLRYFWRNPHGVAHYLGGKVVNLSDDDPPPAGGVLILSPVWLAGTYDPKDRYRYLRARTPDAVIGRCMLVYDLDALR